MADRQFKVAQSDSVTAGKFTPTVLLVDADGNPLDLAVLEGLAATLADFESRISALEP